MSLATDFFCLLGWCWLGQLIDSLIVVGMTMLDYAIRHAPVFGVMYMLYWIWLIYKTIRTGSPEPIMNHVLFMWNMLSGLASLAVNVLRLIRP